MWETGLLPVEMPKPRFLLWKEEENAHIGGEKGKGGERERKTDQRPCVDQVGEENLGTLTRKRKEEEKAGLFIGEMEHSFRIHP